MRKCGEDGGGSATHPPAPVPATTLLFDVVDVVWEVHAEVVDTVVATAEIEFILGS